MLYQNTQYVDYVVSDVALVKQGVELILSQNAQIDCFSVLIWDNMALVGVIPHPLYSRSQRAALEDSIRSDIAAAYGFEEILVSFDMDIYYEILKLNKATDVKDDDASKLFQSVVIRRS